MAFFTEGDNKYELSKKNLHGIDAKAYSRRHMKSIVVNVGVFIITLVFGMLVGWKVLGTGEVVVSLCVLGDVAEKEGYLEREQYLELLQSTGKQIKTNYPILAKSMKLSKKTMGLASEHSNCSQALVAISKGME